jgi:hypothetical protein
MRKYDLMPVAKITRRMCELAKWVPYAAAGRYDLIDPADRIEMVCQQVEIRSAFEKEFGDLYRRLKKEEDAQIEAGLMFRHPQLGVISADLMRDLRRWADE